MFDLNAGQEPQFYKDKAGIRYLKTDKGNPVAVTQDNRGNIMMVDPAGNLYYDAGTPQLGIYMVRNTTAPDCIILCTTCGSTSCMHW